MCSKIESSLHFGAPHSAMVAPISKLSLFAILLLCSAMALATPPATAPAPGPITGALGGEECKDTLVSASPCLSYISAPPSNDSSIAPPECCDAFTSIFFSGKVFCLCYFLKEKLLFGFPIDNSRLLSLSSVCLPPNVTPPANATSPELNNCSDLQALSPLASAGFEPLFPPIPGPIASPPSIASASGCSPMIKTPEASDSPPYTAPESDSDYPPEDTVYTQTSSATKLRISFTGFKNWLGLGPKWQGNPVSVTQAWK